MSNTFDAGSSTLKYKEEFASSVKDPQMMQSPSVASQGAGTGTRMDSMYGDEMDDGSRGVRHGFGVQVW